MNSTKFKSELNSIMERRAWEVEKKRGQGEQGYKNRPVRAFWEFKNKGGHVNGQAQWVLAMMVMA